MTHGTRTHQNLTGAEAQSEPESNDAAARSANQQIEGISQGPAQRFFYAAVN